MPSKIRLLSTDFDGTLVAHGSDPVLDRGCMDYIEKMQEEGVLWAINTGRSVDLLESGLADFEFPIHPDFILTSERDVFRPSPNREKWEPFGDWNERVAREHAELFHSAESVLAEVVDFVNQKTKARLLYRSTRGWKVLVAENAAELERVTRFIDQAREKQPKFHYQRNTVYLRFCHADYHKGAALARRCPVSWRFRAKKFSRRGITINDISMLDGRYARYPACPANAIPEVKEVVKSAGGYVASKNCGAGIHEALYLFRPGQPRLRGEFQSRLFCQNLVERRPLNGAVHIAKRVQIHGHAFGWIFSPEVPRPPRRFSLSEVLEGVSSTVAILPVLDLHGVEKCAEASAYWRRAARPARHGRRVSR